MIDWVGRVIKDKMKGKVELDDHLNQGTPIYIRTRPPYSLGKSSVKLDRSESLDPFLPDEKMSDALKQAAYCHKDEATNYTNKRVLDIMVRVSEVSKEKKKKAAAAATSASSPTSSAKSKSKSKSKKPTKADLPTDGEKEIIVVLHGPVFMDKKTTKGGMGGAQTITRTVPKAGKPCVMSKEDGDSDTDIDSDDDDNDDGDNVIQFSIPSSSTINRSKLMRYFYGKEMKRRKNPELESDTDDTEEYRLLHWLRKEFADLDKEELKAEIEDYVLNMSYDDVKEHLKLYKLPVEIRAPVGALYFECYRSALGAQEYVNTENQSLVIGKWPEYPKCFVVNRGNTTEW
jgi:hypothetical protein